MPCAKDRPQQRNKLHHRQSGERLPVITIDPDATQVATYGAGKQGSAFARMGQTALSPLVGICGETGDVLVVRAPWWVGQRRPRDGRFIGECVGTIPAGAASGCGVDSAGYQHAVVDAADRHDAYFTVTARHLDNVTDAIYDLATSPHTVCRLAADAEPTWAARSPKPGLCSPAGGCG